jgi:hypothetical protein
MQVAGGREERLRRRSSGREDHDGVVVEQLGVGEALVGEVRVWNAHEVERVPHPAFVLRVVPRMDVGDARRGDEVRRDRRDGGQGNGVETEVIHDALRGRPVDDERARWIGLAVRGTPESTDA